MPKRETPLILLADDDKDFKEIISAKLLAEGFEIAEAANGAEAITKAKSLIPDLVVMDIQMPDVNGTEAVVDIKHTPETKDVKIVFFSSMNHPWPGAKDENPEMAKALGAVTFLQKGQDLDSIVKKFKELVAEPNPSS